MITVSPNRIRIEFDGLPLSQNRAWRHGNRVQYRSNAYLEFLERVTEEVSLPDGTIPKCPWEFCRVNIYLSPPTKRKIDVDNRSKTLFDALEHAGFWENDHCVSEMHVFRKGIVRKTGKTVVTVEESEGQYLNVETEN